MENINRNIHMLLQSIKKSSVYKEYRLQEQILKKNPELAERVRQFRSENFRLQNEEDRGQMFQLAEKLSRESAELRRNPQVNAYLDAELEMCIRDSHRGGRLFPSCHGRTGSCAPKIFSQIKKNNIINE